MPRYAGYHTSKRTSWVTWLVVAIIHVVLGIAVYQAAQSAFVRDFIKVARLQAFIEKEKPPPSETPPEEVPEPEPAPEIPPPPPPLTPPPIPEAGQEPPPPQAEPEPPSSGGDAGPQATDAGAFAIGKGGSRFGGYAAILTAAIQANYVTPPSLSKAIEYAVMCQLVLDEEGNVLDYRLMNSSGSEVFDQSAMEALSRLRHVRPPPPGMSRTVLVRFTPPA